MWGGRGVGVGDKGPRRLRLDGQAGFICVIDRETEAGRGNPELHDDSGEPLA